MQALHAAPVSKAKAADKRDSRAPSCASEERGQDLSQMRVGDPMKPTVPPLQPPVCETATMSPRSLRKSHGQLMQRSLAQHGQAMQRSIAQPALVVEEQLVYCIVVSPLLTYCHFGQLQHIRQ